MTVYTLSQARQQLAKVLDDARAHGAVRIQRPDGSQFEIAPVQPAKSPLEVPGVSLGLSADEIVSVLQGVRARDEK